MKYATSFSPNYIRVFLSILLLTPLLAEAQVDLPDHVSVAGMEIALPENGSSWLDSFNQKSAKPALVLAQFSQLPSLETQENLASSGIKLLNYLAANTYLVQIQARSKAANPGIRSIVSVKPSWKISAELAGQIMTSNHIELVVACTPGTQTAELEARITAMKSHLLPSPLDKHAFFEIVLPADRVMELAAWEQVTSLGLAAKDESLNKESARNTTVNIAKGSPAQGGYNLLGDSIVVGVGDNVSGLYHIDTRERVVNFNFAGRTNHGAHTNGTVGGAGYLDQRAEGFAPHATLVDHLYSLVWERTGAMYNGYNMTVTNNSYAARGAASAAIYCAYAGTYDAYSQALDSMAMLYPNVLHVFAAGNEGGTSCSPYPTGYGTIAGGYQEAKNILVVANADKLSVVSPGSSKGPVDDGRLRPDITAIGTSVYSCLPNNAYGNASGTSMSCPGVAGASALLQQHYKRTHAGAYPTSLLSKALLMNGAQDFGRTGPDFQYGYGMMDLARTIKILDSNWYASGSISNAANQTPVTITVPANTAQLKVMLVWHDRPASPLSTSQLVNDLDLTVTDGSSSTYLPFVLNSNPANVTDTAIRAADHKNNVEQVVIDNPASGTYTVNVAGYSVPSGPQGYVVVYDIVPKGVKLTAPLLGDAFNPLTVPVLVFWNASPGTNSFTIDSTVDGGTTWGTLNSNVSAINRMYAWFAPITLNSTQCRVRVTRNGTGEQSTSDLFTIGIAPILSLQANQCPGYVNLQWTSVPNATSYKVLRKIGVDLQTVATTTDTFYYGSGYRTDSTYYFSVVPMYGTIAGYRSGGVSRRPNTGSCTGSFSDNDLMAEAIITPTNGRIGTSTALVSNQTLSVLIQNLDDAAATSYKVSYQVNGGTWQSQSFTGFTANSQAIVNFTGLNLAAAGTYIIRVAIENLGATDPVSTNDTLVAVVRQLQNSAMNLAATPFSDDFESLPKMTLRADTIGFTPNERWDYFSSNDTGRLRTFVDPEVNIGGSRSISMDMLMQTASSPSVNQLVGTFNLSSYTSTSEIRVEFDYKVHGQPKTADSNKVWVRGSDGSGWKQLLAYDLSIPKGTIVHTPSLSVTDVLNAASQSFSSSSQIAFGQFDTSAIAANAFGNGATIDNFKLYLVNNDVGLSAVNAPAKVNCGLGASTSVNVTVINGISAAVPKAAVHYQLDGGAIVADTLYSLGSKASASFTFATPMNASALGAHMLKVWTSIPSDDANSNDTIYYAFRNEPLVAAFPYLENFESSDGYWWSEGYLNTWGWGTPAGQSIKKAASGTKAWKTNLSGYYNDRELSYLYSPCFDISGLTNPMLSFSLNTQIENCGSFLCDGAWVEYSTNNGTTWTKLGSAAQGTNWYSSSSLQLWNVETPVRWRVASIPLPASAQPVRLRFVFNSDEGASFDGIAVDDIHIYDRSFTIYQTGNAGPVTQSVSGNTFTSFMSGGRMLAQLNPGTGSSLGNTDVYVYTHAANSNNANQYYLPKNFVVNTQNTPTDSVTARLFITEAEVQTLINSTGCSSCSKPDDAYELGITKYDNTNQSLENGSLADNSGSGTWEYIPYTRITWVPYDSGYYAQFKVASFSELWFNDGGPANSFPLPIEGLEFDARKTGQNTVVSSWLSHIDTQTLIYELQRSPNARDWDTVALVAAVRDNAHRYNYTDRPTEPTSKALYYRLKYTLQNQRTYYSPTRQIIWTGGNSGIAVYPNPTSDGKLRIDWNTQPGANLDLTVVDITGRSTYAFHATATDYSNSNSIDIGDLAKGVYFLRMVVNGERFELKIMRE